MITVDPIALARHQMTMDREKTKRMPRLYARKMARMTQSPLALLRGSAPLFYDLLVAHPSLAEGPRGKGWLAGDLHLENFGAYRPEPMTGEKAKDEKNAAFDLNDFDDGVVGPWRLDVTRLVTSLILGGRELGADGPRVLDLAHALVDSYATRACEDPKPLPKAPECVARLVETVAARSRKELLDGRTELHRGERRFVRGDRYADLPPSIGKKVERAFHKYTKTIRDLMPAVDANSFDILDAAWRVAGCGSLGGVRVAVLARGKGGPDGAWVFDLKDEDEAPSAQRLLGRPAKGHRFPPAERVYTAYHACVAHPARLLGTTTLGGLSMIARRLSPQEDKLDLTALKSADLDPLSVYLGALAGRAHARGATKFPKKPWSSEERDGVVNRAIALAGIHEAIYLALCKLTREQR